MPKKLSIRILSKLKAAENIKIREEARLLKADINEVMRIERRKARKLASRNKAILKFWDNLDKTDLCWVWTGIRNKAGYGLIYVGSDTITTHRFSYEIHYGSIPKGMFICHRCDNPACVRPDHLFMGTPRDNFMDALNKKRIKPLTRDMADKYDLDWPHDFDKYDHY